MTTELPIIPGDTERIRIYQADAGLPVVGKLGPMTRSALIADELRDHITEYAGCQPSFGLLIRCEGFKGRPYVPPGANAGVTLDYGFDLGQQSEARLRELYGHLWTSDAMDDLAQAVGLRGAKAREWLRGWANFRWEITREAAAQILPRAAAPYWLAAVRACPALAKAPARVQTAMLSVTYSGWTVPVETARKWIASADYSKVAAVVRAAKGSKGRRELEAKLIESVM